VESFKLQVKELRDSAKRTYKENDFSYILRKFDKKNHWLSFICQKFNDQENNNKTNNGEK
jgi:hypothetical protein